MFNKIKEAKKDILLIFGLIVIVGIIALIYYTTRPKPEVAIVSYDNVALFEVDMETGKFMPNTKDYKATSMPVIDGQRLLVDDVEFTMLKEKEGVLVYGHYYFIKGRLGYVKIEYSPSKKKIRVVEETSPYNICSAQDFSNNAPIVCLPNYVSIKFSKSELDDII